MSSASCSETISNKFFHYQIFAKVRRIKFVVVFSYYDMMKRADNMRETFKQFLGVFDNIGEVE